MFRRVLIFGTGATLIFLAAISALDARPNRDQQQRRPNQEDHAEDDRSAWSCVEPRRLGDTIEHVAAQQ